MEGFTYNNIFETKGLEYIIVIIFFLLLIPFWILLTKHEKLKNQIKNAFGGLTLGVLKIPQGIYFSNFHTWAFLEKSGNAKIGIDDFLMHVTGQVNLRVLKNPGEEIKKGEILAEMVHEGKKLSLFSPLSGEIIETNYQITKKPETLNLDPYINGWIFKLKPSSWKTETRFYYLADEAISWTSQELNRFKDFLGASIARNSPGNTALLLQDGGEMIDQPLKELSGDIWNEFQQNFLASKQCRYLDKTKK